MRRHDAAHCRQTSAQACICTHASLDPCRSGRLLSIPSAWYHCSRCL